MVRGVVSRWARRLVKEVALGTCQVCLQPADQPTDRNCPKSPTVTHRQSHLGTLPSLSHRQKP